MRTSAFIIFRTNARQVVSLLPPDLAFLAEFIEDDEPFGDPPNVTCSSTVIFHAAQIERLIQWGRQVIDGQSILQTINLGDHPDYDDLAGLPAVEILISDEVAHEYAVEMDCTEDNTDDAYTVWWDCDHCRRVRWLQTGDLEVTPPRDLDFQWSTLGNWFVSARLAPMLEAHGVRLRPLKNRDDYRQIACGPVAIRPDLWPVAARHPCPHCGRFQFIRRESIIEGAIIPSTYAGVNIRRSSALTLLSDGPLPALGRVNLGFNEVHYAEGQELHYVGQPILPGDVNLFTHMWPAYYLASQPLYRALLDAEATGIKFLPVNAPTS